MNPELWALFFTIAVAVLLASWVVLTAHAVNRKDKR